MLLRCSPALLSFRLLRRRRFFVRCRCYPSSAASRRRRLAPPQGLGCGPGSASLGLPSILLGAVVGDCGRPSRFRRPGKRLFPQRASLSFPSSLLLRSLSTHASELWPGVAAPLFSHASVPPENLAVFQLVRVVQLVPVGAVVVPVGCLFFPAAPARCSRPIWHHTFLLGSPGFTSSSAYETASLQALATAHIPQSQKLCDPLDELTLTIDYYHKNVQKLHGYYETNKQKYISTRLQTETSSLAGNRWDWMNATEE
ncbi:uncharacterized protein [Miscanthus floridulus]|uniref:uncharacterized protein isoform X4 n=1 Tax=Miscanthus floridulus TaxID=154761 RepID=UPI00345B0430